MANLMDAYEGKILSTDAGGGTHQVQKLEKRYGVGFVKTTYRNRPAQPLPTKKEIKISPILD